MIAVIEGDLECSGRVVMREHEMRAMSGGLSREWLWQSL